MATAHIKTGKHEAVEERRRQVWALRLAGASERAIADQVKVSQVQVHRDLGVMKARIAREQYHDAQEWRTIELARLDKLLIAAWQDATTPSAKGRNFSIDRVLSIMERRAKLLGLDAPLNVRMETMIVISPVDLALLEKYKMTAQEAWAQLIKDMIRASAMSDEELAQIASGE